MAVYAPAQRDSGGWLRSFVVSLLLVVFGLCLGVTLASLRPATRLPVSSPAADQQLSASPNYAYVMTLWLNMENIASTSNALDDSANDYNSRAISYSYFRTQAERLDGDMGRYTQEAKQITPPDDLRDLHQEYLDAADELNSSTALLSQAVSSDQPDAKLLQQSEQQRMEAVARLETVSDELVARVWHRPATAATEVP